MPAPDARDWFGHGEGALALLAAAGGPLVLAAFAYLGYRVYLWLAGEEVPPGAE